MKYFGNQRYKIIQGGPPAPNGKGRELVTYFKEGLIIDTNRVVFKEAGFDEKDALWYVHIYYEKITNKPLDTIYFTPSGLSENGEGAQTFFGTRQELIAYAERKNIRRFCYKDSLGMELYIHLKENENY